MVFTARYVVQKDSSWKRQHSLFAKTAVMMMVALVNIMKLLIRARHSATHITGIILYFTFTTSL